MEAALQGAAAIKTGHDHRHLRIMAQRKARPGAKSLLHCPKRFLWLPAAGSQPHPPVVDLSSRAPPVVGVTENNCPGETPSESAFDLPLEDLAFAQFTFSQRVDAALAQQQRLGFRLHLQ